MMTDIGNYAKHAKIWDWGGHDNTPEHTYWYEYAKHCGKNVLIPMCALGEAGAYMAERGLCVTAFDITQEMIEEAKKRFADVANLNLRQGDIRDFAFEIQPVDFVFIKDLGHLHTIEDVKSAFAHIHSHMRNGGALVIEQPLPAKESSYHPPESFYPQKQMYHGLKVWKVGETRHDAEDRRTYISQTVYIQDDSGAVESFDHSFYLQWFEREELIVALDECGFRILHEYKNRAKEPWHAGDCLLIVEAIKKACVRNK